MWRFIAGFGIGVYVGTYYECKPTLEYIRKVITDQVPKKSESERST
jgi:hypothetical protein